MLLASVACLVGAWLILTTASMALSLFVSTSADQEIAREHARAERQIADLKARLDSAVAHLDQTEGSVGDLARTVEKRHQALALMLGQFRGVPGAQQALAPEPAPDAGAVRSPLDRVLAVRLDQERLVAKAETFARSRAERLRLAFRLAGLNPGVYTPSSGSGGLGGPLIDAKDPKALATVLDVDDAFATRIQHAAADLGDMRALESEEHRLPLSRPTILGSTTQTSGFGVRFDPFNGRPALHTGLDFAGPMMTPVHATAPGVVSYTGPRSGYGNVVEIDHGGGFKTRYAHLQTIAVHVGERVALGERIAGMGSTGRSTGPHVHYEIWVNGRPENPIRFIKAGDYVQ